ncbi:M30 family zinc metallopeptidase [Chitinolyticbacter meiyuanensis]|uniref:M30 family zinc metallopeptidase n=1 Tax=Chitinolyticbacter meiyuanensis TaxID=682798 RepID=UPI001652A6D6|nr:hemagglutinin [Chitinolyticbacter meiyuanensis]
MPPITLSLLQRSPRRAQLARDDAAQPVNQIPAQIREFNRNPPLDRTTPQISRNVSSAEKPSAAIVGNNQIWYVHVDQMETRTATLRRKLTAADGRIINFWVENGEFAGDRLTETQLDTIASRFSTGSNAIYGMVTGLAGEPWGAHSLNDLIGPNQELDIVLVNFDHDNQPYGLMGYFWSYNNFKRSTSTPQSNESLSLYLDTETIYRTAGDTGLKTQLNTLAHELTHMINFYQRGVVLDNTFDTFLEETSALMMEDIVGLRIDPDYHPIRDGRFPDWLNQAGYNCNVTTWDDDSGSACFSYSVNGSFGGYLLRYYGVEFYRRLLRDDSSSNSVTLLDNAIRGVGGLGLADAVRRWGTSIALLPALGTPATFGYPERIDSGYTLPGINGPDYLADRVLPSSVPSMLQGYAHFPVVRTPAGNSYNETISVPPGTTLSVIVQ